MKIIITTHFYESVTSSGFMPQITLPTRLSDSCDTLIDNILTNNFEKNYKNFLLTRIICDHKMTCCILPNHNAVKRVNREYIDVEYINENTLEQRKCHINMVTNKLSKVIGILNRLKNGQLLWGTHVNRISKLQRKNPVRIMSNSEYLAHSEPLFKTLK